MNIEEFMRYCAAKKGVTEEFPFDEHTLCLKVMGKIFAITGLDAENFRVNLKCDPNYAIELREQYPEVQPGYHMHKAHWNTVDFEGSLDDRLLKQLIDHSYSLVAASLKKEERLALAALQGYHEKHRPQFHFSPPSHWMNDPNGLVYFEGEYHFFYQYFPDDIVWGPMHWGHAVSRDLIHWEHLPIALYPDDLGYIFSGSAVVDWDNTSGFGENGRPPLVAFFTYHDMDAQKAEKTNYQSQAIAYSNDNGRTWTKYIGNPVIANPGNIRDFRDPKVFFHGESGRWIMAIAVHDHTQFWSSTDLKNWHFESGFGKNYGAHGGDWECPDLIPLKTSEGHEKWVLIQNINPGGLQGGSGTQYFIGDFDGKTFTLDPDFAREVPLGTGIWLDGGKDNYAGVTFSDVPNGRRILMGWMSNWEYAQKVPTEKWRSAATLPVALFLEKTASSYRLRLQPVEELQVLRQKNYVFGNIDVKTKAQIGAEAGFSPTPSELLLEIRLPEMASGTCGIELSNKKKEKFTLGFDLKKNAFFIDRKASGDSSFHENFGAQRIEYPRFSSSKQLKMHVFIDVASIELFADDGLTTMTQIFFPSEPFSRLEVFAEKCTIQIEQGQFFQIKSIWT